MLYLKTGGGQILSPLWNRVNNNPKRITNSLISVKNDPDTDGKRPGYMNYATKNNKDQKVI